MGNRTREADETLTGDILEGKRPLKIRGSMTLEVMKLEDGADVFYIAQIPQLLCSGIGATRQEAIASFRKEFAGLWISVTKKDKAQLDSGGVKLHERLKKAARRKIDATRG